MSDQSGQCRAGKIRGVVIENRPLLAVDVGNSRIKYGWFVPERLESGRVWPRCSDFFATPLAAPVPWETLRSWSGEAAFEVVAAGSNPAVVEATATQIRSKNQRSPWVPRERSGLPLTIEVDQPERVGLDRLLNAIAVNVLRPVEQPAIVIDSGTATTVDLVCASGAFQGGAILPGFALSAEALHRYTALLPRLGLADLGPAQPAALGRNTEAALRSGIYWGQVGAIRTLVEKLTQACAASGPPWLVLTGGGAAWLASEFASTPVVPSLAMHGLVLAAWQSPQSPFFAAAP